MKVKYFTLLLAGLFVIALTSPGMTGEFKIGIMQAKAGDAKKYKPLLDYFKAKGIDVALKGYSNYPDAAIKFEKGDVDGMFAGSGVAASMMIKEVAYPLIRPVHQGGWSTYWAVIIAPKGSQEFTGDKDFFDGKTITCSSLASSGEFFARSILGAKRDLLKAGSHGIALSVLERGTADVAIVKNRVWDAERAKYPDLEEVGKDTGENPDNTLIISYKTDKDAVEKVKTALLELGKNNSPEAEAVKKAMQITSFIPTTETDFSHTLALVKKAGVTKDFNFTY